MEVTYTELPTTLQAPQWLTGSYHPRRGLNPDVKKWVVNLQVQASTHRRSRR
jgi:hypothetical protein